MLKFDFESKPEYWEKLYDNYKLAWDIGYIATPLKEYFDQLIDKSIRILVPGAGNAYEVEYLFRNGFNNVFLLDFTQKAIENFKLRVPYFPDSNILNENFFKHQKQYDLIVELAFFSSLHPKLREDYVLKMNDLLYPGGKLVGLLFNVDFDHDLPPFGGNVMDYKRLFKDKFKIKTINIAYNSIKPRMGRELFVNMLKS